MKLLGAAAICFVAAVFLTTGGRSTKPSDPPRKIRGSWGGDHIHLVLTEAGGRAEFDCARGSVDEPFLADTDGKFDLKGTFVPEHPGPVHRDEKADEHPARYRGSVQGNDMVLTVAVPDRNQLLGPFQLSYGKDPRVHRCL